MRKLIAQLAACFVLAAMPAQDQDCAEGLKMLNNTLVRVNLSNEEFVIVTDLLFKAKLEAERGNTQKCVYILGDVIRLVFLRQQ